MTRPTSELVEGLRAASHDERLSAGALYSEAADALERLEAQNAALRERLNAERPFHRALILRDHFTSCDRTMGDSHPCTCGMNEYRKLLQGLDSAAIDAARGDK